MVLTHPSSPLGTTWPSCLWVTPATPVQLGGWCDSQWEVWAILTFFISVFFFLFAHMVKTFSWSASNVFVCTLMVLRVRVSMCLWYQHMPAVYPRSVIKTDWVAGCCFATNPQRFSLYRNFPPTVSGCLAFIQQDSGRHWRRHFRQLRPQQLKCISHQELSIRYLIPPVFVTAVFLLLFSVYIA